MNGNPFSHPHLSRKAILERTLVSSSVSQYQGKGIIFVFFTRHCGVGCPFCFFKSAPAAKETTIEDEFDDQGIDRFIEFANKANLGYLAISGGGEPLNMRKAVLRSIEEIESNTIALNTSGSWALNERAANRYIDEIYAAWERRKQPCHVNVRLSVSEGHSIKLGIKPAVNLISIFRKRFFNHPYFKMAIHTFSGDRTLPLILDHFKEAVLKVDPSSRASADDLIVKIIPKKTTLYFPEGYSLIVGLSRVFSSGLRPNLNRPALLESAIQIYQEDLEFSEDFFPTVVDNYDGSKGIDWAINYNGNVCAWTNQVNDYQFNIYEDSYETVLQGTFKDPLSLAIMEKGTEYRDAIVSEVDPRAVLRLRSISLRDYAGTIIFEEEKTRLYFTLRALQDFFKQNCVDQREFSLLPKKLQELICGQKEEVRKAYSSANYTIIDQYKRKPFDRILWRDLFELIKLSHYNLTEEQIQEAIKIYNSHVKESPLDSLEDIQHELGNIERRLTERLMYMKPLDHSLEKIRRSISIQ